MAEIDSWQRQNMKKSGAAPAPHDMNAKLHCGHGTMNSKIAKPTHSMGGMVAGGADRPIAHFADGGEVDESALKSQGLAASADEKVGFFERLKMGNIDEKGSEAYNRFGAGRAKGDESQSIREDAAMARKAEANRGSSDSDGSYARVETQRLAKVDPPTGTDTNFGTKATEDRGFTPSAPKTAARPVAAARSAAASSPAPAFTGGGRTMTEDPRRLDRPSQVSPDARSKSATADKDRTTLNDAFEAAKPGSKFEWNGKQYEKEPANAAPVPAKRDYRRVTPVTAERGNDVTPATKAKQAVGEALTSSGSGAASRYLQAKMGRGESLSPAEQARAKQLGLSK